MRFRFLFLFSLSVSASAFAGSLKLEVICQYLKGTGDNREQLNVSVLTDLQTSEKIAEIYSRFEGKESEVVGISVVRREDSMNRVYESSYGERSFKMGVRHIEETKGIHIGSVTGEIDDRHFQEQPVKCAIFQ